MANKTARRTALALAGLAVTGGAVVGMAGTAQAAAPAGHPATTATHGGWYGWNGNENEVVAVFRTYRECAWTARVGQARGYWGAANCDFIRTGYRGHWRHQWGTQFNRIWDGGNWQYRGVWVLRADVD